ncbi:MAG TPA: phosphopentomutase [Deinococcales bacterium]|nr:phosphopentomutase [Deinococcales bacterium]
MKFTIVVLDSVGVGALPDAAEFGDAGAHTLNHTLAATGAKLPNLAALGAGRLPGVEGLDAPGSVHGAFGRLREVSKGKDTSTGHWEFMGTPLEHPFRTFTESGFPPEVMDRFSRAIGRGWLCNRAYSGTDVIRDYGEEHLRTGLPIVYTSADSVFQIATHVDVTPLETLYAWCRAAREILQGDFAVARVIARPFKGAFPFERVNEARHDFSLEPPRNVLDVLFEAGRDVIGIGKIPDIYAERGFTQKIHTDNNADGMNKTLAAMSGDFDGLVFTNLVDFDAKFGHRRDPQGYANALAEFDAFLPRLEAAVPEDGLLVLVSDHGNDPTWTGTDHTREHGLLLAYRPGIGAVDLGDRASFADLGATVAEALNVRWDGPGESFLSLLR